MRILEGLPIKSFMDLDDLPGFDDVVKGVLAVMDNREECFIRELSMRVYGDSKKLERLQHKIANIIGTFCVQRQWLEYEEDILRAYNVVKNPTVLMLKGDVGLRLGSGALALGELRYGIGINSKDIWLLEFAVVGCAQGERAGLNQMEPSIRTILTVENLTTFYSAQKDGALMIYLAGFHNEARRNLIREAPKGSLQSP